MSEDPRDRVRKDRMVRALALGGVLQLLRTREGRSVEQAAVHAGIGHMTWRRVEDGMDVRSKTYAALDGVLSVPPGTVQCALNDDELMVGLIRKAGVADIPSGTSAQVVERFVRQTMSNSSRQRGSVHIGPALVNALPTAAKVPATPAQRAPTDLAQATELIERIARRQSTPRLDAAVQALLQAMPDLIARRDEDPNPLIRDPVT